jgi:hypothetical protein
MERFCDENYLWQMKILQEQKKKILQGWRLHLDKLAEGVRPWLGYPDGIAEWMQFQPPL